MDDLIYPILLTLLIVGLVGVFMRLDKFFFKRRSDRDETE